MSTVQGTLDTLVAMGFTEDKAKRALNKTGWQGVEQAMDWLLAHQDDLDVEEDQEEEKAPEPEVERKELTPEERAAKLQKLEELRIQKKLEREEREKKELLEREKKRIEDGKKMSEIKEDYAMKEMLLAAEQRKKEKQADALHLEKIRAQIQADRERQKQAKQGNATPVSPAPAVVPPSAPVTASLPAKDYDSTKIQVRLPDGKALVQTFKSKETLASVRVYVSCNRNDGSILPVKFMTNFPKKVFSDEDFEKPLDELGLVPSAVLIVMK